MKRKAPLIQNKITLVFVNDGYSKIEVKTARVLAHFKMLDKMLKDANDVDDEIVIPFHISLEGFKFCYDIITSKEKSSNQEVNIKLAYSALVAANALLFDYMEKLFNVIANTIILDLTGRKNNKSSPKSYDYDDLDYPIIIPGDYEKRTVVFSPQVNPQTCLDVPKDMLSNFVLKHFSFQDFRESLNQRQDIGPFVLSLFKTFVMNHLQRQKIDTNIYDAFEVMKWLNKNYIKSRFNLSSYFLRGHCTFLPDQM